MFCKKQEKNEKYIILDVIIWLKIDHVDDTKIKKKNFDKNKNKIKINTQYFTNKLMAMIPEKILKREKREETATILEKLTSYWYSNIELGELLKTDKSIKVKIWGLKVQKWDYPISLEKLEPITIKAKELLEKIENK